ncbi:transporter substrate-binding domain-containing protein [Sphingobium sp. DEHP117]|uniref:substrate-binding periplasmic protein n=1 Tax=Sphingobium sp. DEHP117 TaxID=2993436 RepID=UPI0027D55D20|nr:transporter substrate-binding domain-containing protein [Sphingobium sp. DEHP117]MDQ4421520.1 transporter substrate-binding domain-containing protein [Sphingobium sp. DEHP117]
MRTTDRRAFLLGLSGAALGGALGVWPGALSAAPLDKVRQTGVLRVAVYKDNKPWSWEEGGQLRGIDSDIARALAEALGVRPDLAELMADESVEDDLRNGVWKGGLLGFQPADVMMHIPFDRTFAARNDQVAIVAPYYREKFTLACASGSGIDCEAVPREFRGRRLAVELDSIPDNYFLSVFGGLLAKDVVHYLSGSAAVQAMTEGKADLALTTAAQMENGLSEVGAERFVIRKSALPLMMSPGWDIGLAVKENSRSLGDALEDSLGRMASSGRLAEICSRYGVHWVAPLAGG